MLIENAQIDDQPDIERMIAGLNAIGAAHIRVASLLKSQKILTGSSSQLENLLQQAISDVLEENAHV